VTTLLIESTDSARDEQRLFARMIALSVVLHLILGLSLAAWKWISPSHALVNLPNAIQIDLTPIATAAPPPARDPRRLPQKETFVPPLKPKPDEPVPEPEEGSKPVLKEKAPREAKTLEEAMKKDPTPTPSPGLKEDARARLNRLVAQARTRERVAKLTGAAAKAAQTAGEMEGVAGGTGVGTSAGRDPAWGAALQQRFSLVWILRKEYTNKDLKAIVYVKIDAEGRANEVKLVRTSGDLGFDKAAVRAVAKAQPIPLPTEADLRKMVLDEGFHLGFNPKGIAQ